jgi:hypothetical protein
MRTRALEIKVVASVAAVLLAAAAASGPVAGALVERSVEQAALTTLQRAATAFSGKEEADIEKLGAALDAILANEALRDAFASRDRARLQELARPLFETMRERDRITHWYFIDGDAERRVFLRVHKPELYGDRVERITLRRAAETREIGAGKELGRTAFALRVVRPWFHDGQLVGYVELAEEIDHFLTALNSGTGDEYGLLVKKKYLDERRWAEVLGPRANTWNDRPDVVVVDTTTLTQGIVEYDGDLEDLPDAGRALGEVERDGRAYVRGIFPVRDAADRKVGAVFVQHDFTAMHLAVKAGAGRAALALLGIAVLAAGAVGALLHLLVFVRLDRVGRRLEERAVADGLPPNLLLHLAGDEVARLEALASRPAGAASAPRDAAPGAPGR